VTVLSSGVAPRFVHAALAGAPGPVNLLGSFPTAGYLQLGSGAVIAVLTSDAVQLPIGVTLPWSSSELELPALLRSGVVRPGRCPELRLGRFRITVSGERNTSLVHCGRPVQLESGAGPRIPLDDLDRIDPFEDPKAAVDRLLGRGPGLTPAGDDLLCGALAATVLFGIDDHRLAEAVRRRLAGSHRATTGLSGQLLLRALAGDGPPELQHLGRTMCQPDPLPCQAAWRRLLAIGHSSGAALGAGLLAGARHAAAAQVAA
jgi:hypothetical protein